MSAMLKDPMFFYGIAFVIFLGLAYRYGRKPLSAWIDSEILKIRDELDQARQLREDAEAMLQDYKAKQKAALAEAEEIVANAKAEAESLKVQAETDLKNALARHEQQAIERIRIAESEALRDVRTATIDLAMSLATQALSSNLDEASAAKLVDQAIAEMPKAPAKKAEAA
jgi:F-type H+-transporting ATPase subunit b